MLATSTDILHISISLGVILVTIFLSMFLFYGILILRDLSKVVKDAQVVSTKVKSTIIKPIALVEMIITRIHPIIEKMIEKKLKSKK